MSELATSNQQLATAIPLSQSSLRALQAATRTAAQDGRSCINSVDLWSACISELNHEIIEIFGIDLFIKFQDRHRLMMDLVEPVHAQICKFGGFDISPRLDKVLNATDPDHMHAPGLALQHDKKEILPEHILYAICWSNEGTAKEMWEKLGISKTEFTHQLVVHVVRS